MTSQKLKYQLANGTISGYIANKTINFAVRPAQQGSHPPPGSYDIHPPNKDPVYGMVAIMTPANSAISLTRAGGSQVIFRPHGSTNQGVFVLSSRPITGQNSLVISTGFADLMDALEAAHGASVTVA